jgi:hypothetical protein
MNRLLVNWVKVEDTENGRGQMIQKLSVKN